MADNVFEANEERCANVMQENNMSMGIIDEDVNIVMVAASLNDNYIPAVIEQQEAICTESATDNMNLFIAKSVCNDRVCLAEDNSRQTECYADSSERLDLEESVDKLTSGLLMNVLPEEERLKKQLNDIIQSQNVLTETIQQENAKFREMKIIKEVSDIMDRARIYQTKLVNIQKEMMSLHEKTSQLKRRALKLQQQKQKEALQKEHQRDEELEKEKKLMAKVILRKS